jgi:hypothetical protein
MPMNGSSALKWLGLGLASALLAACSEGPTRWSARATVREHLTSGNAPPWACGVLMKKGEYKLDFETFEVVRIGEAEVAGQGWPVEVHVQGTCESTLFLLGAHKDEARTPFEKTLHLHLRRDAQGDWRVR